MEVAMLKTSMTELASSFYARMAYFEAKLPESGSAPTLAAEFASFKVFISETMSTLQRQIELLANQLDVMETRRRRKMLLLHGVAERADEVTQDVACDVITKSLKMDFMTSQIKRCHRMGRSAGGSKPRTIIIKFDSVAVRDKVWFAKSNLRGSGITISEFLTRQRHQIFMAAREKFGVARCWTREGVIFVLDQSNKRHRCTSLGELQMLPLETINKPVTPAKPAPKTKRTVKKR